MPLHPQDHQLIEQYLLGQLSEADQATFDNRLSDQDFKYELELQKNLITAFKASGRDQLKNQLKGFEKKIENESSIQTTLPRFRIGRVLAIAAALALLIVAGYFIMNQGVSNDQLFADHFKPYPNVVNPIDKSSEPTDRQGEAFRTYELGNYQEAIEKFEQLNTKGEAVYLYKGISELALGNAEGAISSLEKVKNENSSYYNPARWYMALALIYTDRTTEAIPLLEYVEKKAGTAALKNQATQLLQQIR